MGYQFDGALLERASKWPTRIPAPKAPDLGPPEPVLELLNQLGTPYVLLDTTGSVLAHSKNAAPHLKSTLSIATGRIRVPGCKSSNARLQEMLARVASNPGGVADNAVLIRREQGRPLMARLRKVVLREVPYVLVCLCDLDRGNESVPGDFQHVFGLTSAEMRVVHGLHAELDLDAIAGSGGTTVGTVRSQLKAVFSKIGIFRQQELVAFLVRSSTNI